jgi:hypothetical protein
MPASKEAVCKAQSDQEIAIRKGKRKKRKCGAVRLGWRVHISVLLRNHYHLMLETP